MVITTDWCIKKFIIALQIIYFEYEDLYLELGNIINKIFLKVFLIIFKIKMQNSSIIQKRAISVKRPEANFVNI